MGCRGKKRGAAGGNDAERGTPFRVRAPTAAPGTREAAELNELANSEETAAAANKEEENVKEARMLLCKLTTS